VSDTDLKIVAEKRTQFGKGAARKIRRDHKIPAVMYGHGAEPVHITLPGHDTMMALKTANALLSVDIEGRKELVIPKAVQRDALKGFIKHVDLLAVKLGEKVTVEVAVHTEGELAPGPFLLENVLSTLTVEAEATHIPEYVEVSVEGAEVGHQVFARDLQLPSGSRVLLDDDVLVVNVTHAPTAEEVESELAGAEAEAGIEHDEPTAGAEGGDTATGGEETSAQE
jgi:large subunit ribosomal protein L25